MHFQIIRNYESSKKKPKTKKTKEKTKTKMKEDNLLLKYRKNQVCKALLPASSQGMAEENYSYKSFSVTKLLHICGCQFKTIIRSFSGTFLYHDPL